MHKMYDLIEKKKHGKALTKDEIEYIVKGYTDLKIPDYQMSAFLMAAWFNKFSEQEVYYLTQAMVDSGDVFDLSVIKGIKADKHSTGGVGDKISLILAPIISTLGVKVAKMSGKGLGFTGGTVDKLESIPGFTSLLNKNDFLFNIDKIGMSITSQSANLVPADKKIYALRDVTAIVDDIPLIASSIMSKKLAMGADIIVLDVKCGNGGFMKEFADALKLAKLMVDIGLNASKKISTVITDMNVPLGRCIGNSLEVIEAVMCLRGDMPPDIKEVTYALGAQILILADIAASEENAFELMDDAVASKRAYYKFLDFITAQGGDISRIEDISLLKTSEIILNVYAQNEGYISSYDCSLIGRASAEAGAGRMQKGDNIDYGAGIYLNKIYGEHVNKGDIIAQVYSSYADKAANAAEMVQASIAISQSAPKERKLIKGIINE